MNQQPNQPRAERRQAERKPIKTTVICEMGPRGSERTLFGEVLDVSVSGAQILCKHDIRSGEELDLTFLDNRRDTIAQAHATVVWHHQESAGAFRIGVNLTRQLTYEEIASIS